SAHCSAGNPMRPRTKSSWSSSRRASSTDVPSPPARDTFRRLAMLHVVLTGFMASGKTAVGRRLARRLGFDFVDTDQVIEDQAGATVSEIFAREGEPAFRRLERETIEGLALERPTVIA